jgi:ADP-dependent phosphofructokinase/glucokinase
MYHELLDRFDELVARSRPTLAGFTACVDVVLALDDALLDRIRTADGAGSRMLAELLVDCAGRGRGGERLVDWPEGPGVLDAVAGGARAIGGTGAQVAQTLGVLGAPAVLCLEDRSPQLLGLLDPDVMVLEGSDTRSVAEARPGDREQAKPPHFIFEFVAGSRLAGRAVPRSSRVIVRFAHEDLEDDRAFDAYSPAVAARAGGAVVSGFNALPSGALEAAYGRVAGLTRSWREAGLDVVHLELAAYDSPAGAHESCARLAPLVSSIGMSRSELAAIAPDDLGDERQASWLADRYAVETVVVHDDRRSFAVTSGDAERIGEALLVANLCAATRASSGAPRRPVRGLLPLPAGGWSCTPGSGGRTHVTCASPYLRHASSTVGLGDTFVAGLLLALGASSSLLSRQPETPSRSVTT